MSRSRRILVIVAFLMDTDEVSCGRYNGWMSTRANIKAVPTALTIAGSDSSGGAGIQADLKTFTRLGVYGMSVITAVTAQNTLGIGLVAEVAPPAVAAQLTSVLEDIFPSATKIGMLGSDGNVKTVVEHCTRYDIPQMVLDPVMRSSSGTVLLSDEGVELMRSELLPLAFVITPNLDEAEALTGSVVRVPDQMEEAARSLHGLGARNVLVKGGHLESNRLVDVLFNGKSVVHLIGNRIENVGCHGTGCVMSAAITAHLALGSDVETAVARAHAFTRQAVRNGLDLGRGQGPCDPVGLDT